MFEFELSDVSRFEKNTPNGFPDTPLTPRQKYLARIGLERDPFLKAVAEDELAFSAFSLLGAPARAGESPTPSFFAYYTPPPIPVPAEQTLLQVLRLPDIAFIYGPPGAGKTTLRLNLDAKIRRTPEQTLTVTYIFGRDVDRPLDMEMHYQRLAQAIATALFIQIAEQFNPLIPVTDPQRVELQYLLFTVGGPSLRRLVQRFLDEDEPPGGLGFGHLWVGVGQPAVRYVDRSEPLRDLLQSIKPRTGSFMEPRQGWNAFSTGLRAARAWGYKQIYLLIDGVTSNERSETAGFELISPLLDQVFEWQQSQGLLAKFFLPDGLAQLVTRYLRSTTRLPSPPFSAKIEWSEAALRKLLAQRFRAARSRRTGFNDLADPAFKGDLDSLLVRRANRSPRRLLLIISALLNAHAERDPQAEDPLIRPADWEKARAAPIA